ncbi:thioredoxin domain-containing protein 16-like isoform X2 [Physella acuta]|uniref:thioredoxin domain-containing protein 16-like isoform X2 n=1 Tax=Physella acuta TaxID=109671 RepID=UPI0027DB2609|nr:thioredoxin domain-containing protein 16-like isoform X2 [Physella acuta]
MKMSSFDSCMATLVLLLVIGVASSWAMEDKSSSNTERSIYLTSQELKEFRKTPHLLVVYYYVKPIPGLFEEYMKQFEQSATYLEAYKIKLGVFDCTSDTSGEAKCKEAKVERNVFAYQLGKLLAKMELETMFDVNSIMSNALQLVLVNQVNIIQSRLERQAMQKNLIGKKNLFFAYPQAVGTKEHRIFMEVAYTYQDDYNFALTTELKTTVGLQDSQQVKSSLALWVFFCSETTPEEFAEYGDCLNMQYQGEISLAAVAKFIKNLQKQVLHYATPEEIDNLFYILGDIQTVYIYTNKVLEEKIAPVVEFLKFNVRGYGRVVVVDMDTKVFLDHANKQGFHGKLPAIAVASQNRNVRFMNPSIEWELSNIIDFLFPLMFPQENATVRYSPEYSSNPQIEEVETEDDQVADAVFKMQSFEMELDFVPALFKSDFYKTVQSSDLLFVLFYLPFDHVSMAFLRDYGHAAQVLHNNFSDANLLARVNCYDATDVCGLENITTYPVLRIYQKNKDSHDYKWSLDWKSMVKAVKLLQLHVPVLLNTEEDVEMFMQGKYPKDFSKFSHTSVLLLASHNDNDKKEMFLAASKDYLTSVVIGIVSEELTEKIGKKLDASVPSVVAYHRRDEYKPTRILRNFSTQTLTEFIKLSQYTSLPELTVASFPALFSKKLPLAILFLNGSDSTSKSVKDMFYKLAETEQFNDVIFCWMNAQLKTIGLKILSEYTYTATLPMVVVVNLRDGEVYNYQAEELVQADIEGWMSNVFSHKVAPSKILEKGKWVPTRRAYDFLAMIDKDRMVKNERLCIEGREEEDNISERTAKNLHSQNIPGIGELPGDDEEIRKELLEIRKSRLYHVSPERLERSAKLHDGDAAVIKKKESLGVHGQSHIEL